MSLTVNRKLRVLETELKASIVVPASPPGSGPVVKPPASMVDSCGKYLVGEVAGGKVSQFGPVVFVGLALLLAPV